jgi:hypothetical protein
LTIIYVKRCYYKVQNVQNSRVERWEASCRQSTSICPLLLLTTEYYVVLIFVEVAVAATALVSAILVCPII